MRTLIRDNPFAAAIAEQGHMPCAWITCPAAGDPPYVIAFRRSFSLDRAATVRLHVSADERYELFLDGHRFGRGPERGDRGAWFFETYDLIFDAGAHVLVARVWSLGALAPVAQMSVAPGLILLAEPPFDTLLSTGVADWETQRLEGYCFVRATDDEGFPWFTGPNLVLDAARYPWGVESGAGATWGPVATRERGEAPDRFGAVPLHVLTPATLPAMLEEPRLAGMVRFVAETDAGDPSHTIVRMSDHRPDEAPGWQALLAGYDTLTLPPHTRRRVIIDLGSYYCAYPRLVASGGRGGSISLRWAEAPYLDSGGQAKGQRDRIENSYVLAMSGDTLHLDGGAARALESPWWRAGRYLELVAETVDEPLTIADVGLRETRYPLEMESRFDGGDERLQAMIPIAWRTIQMCAHETYMDCPYYEQLMYAGDTRLQVLVTYVMSRDDRLPRKALAMFDSSRLSSGLTQSRYPSRDTQIIPPFALWWVTMVYDYALWRDDRATVMGLLPGVRGVVEAYLRYRRDDDVIAALPGWNFVDWVPEWPIGIPPDAARGVSGTVNWQCVLALGLVARLEAWVGEPELARRAHRRADALAGRLGDLFWDDQRGLFADDLGKEHFSEHTQCLALLSGQLNQDRRTRVAAGLLGDPTLSRATIYFAHYLFEAYRELHRIEALFDRLGLWLDLAPHGFKTTPEISDVAATRSDCHAWGAHPLYHLFASILGLRPASFGFDTVEIAPQLGPLQEAHGTLVHPKGAIDVALKQVPDGLSGVVTLPDGVSGLLRYHGMTQALAPGRQDVRVKNV